MTRAVIIALLLATPCHAGKFLTLISSAAAATAPQPAPGPAPQPGGVCDNCNGTGRLGDGTVSVPCPVCGGDGKLDAGANSRPADPPAASGGAHRVVPCDAQASQMAKRKTAVPDRQPQPGAFPTSGAPVYPQSTGEANGAAKTPPPSDDAPPVSPDQESTPMEGVTAGLNALRPLAGKTLVVYGSGWDARWEISAAKRTAGVKVVGIEIDPDVAASARAYVTQNGVDGQVEIRTADATLEDVQADIGAAYLWPETLEALRPKLEQLERFVSYMHPVPGGVPGMRMRQIGDLYVYEKPKPVAAQPLFQKAKTLAVWNGRQYSGPVCSRPGCSMCNAIRRQLR